MKPQKVAIDIQDLNSGAILDSLLENGGEVFRTAKHRKAVLIGQAAFLALSKQFSLSPNEGPDGTKILKD